MNWDGMRWKIESGKGNIFPYFFPYAVKMLIKNNSLNKENSRKNSFLLMEVCAKMYPTETKISRQRFRSSSRNSTIIIIKLSDRLLRLPEVLEIVPIKKSTLYDLMRRSLFPKNIKLDSNIVA